MEKQWPDTMKQALDGWHREEILGAVTIRYFVIINTGADCSSGPSLLSPIG